MKTFSRWILAFSLVFSSIFFQSTAGAKADVFAAPVIATKAMDDSAVALLPQSDVVAILDVNRLINDLLPKVKQAWPDQVAKVEKEINEIFSDAAKSGVDLYKVKTLTVGLKLFGAKTSGAMIVDGLTVTPGMMATEGKESSTIDYKGKTMYIEKSKPEPKPAAVKRTAKGKTATASRTRTRAGKARSTSAKAVAPSSANPLGNVTDVASNMGANLLKESTAYVQLDAERAAIGDESEVKAVIDALMGSPTSTVSPELSTALQETKPMGLLRFAVNIPESARKAAEGEEFLKNLAVTKMVMGTLDVSDDMSLLLDAKLRTGSADEASKLHESLAALLGLGKMMLGGNQDPTMLMLSKMLDQIRLSPQSNDVTLAITLPRELYETFLKSNSKATPAKNDK